MKLWVLGRLLLAAGLGSACGARAPAYVPAPEGAELVVLVGESDRRTHAQVLSEGAGSFAGGSDAYFLYSFRRDELLGEDGLPLPPEALTSLRFSADEPDPTAACGRCLVPRAQGAAILHPGSACALRSVGRVTRLELRGDSPAVVPTPEDVPTLWVHRPGDCACPSRDLTRHEPVETCWIGPEADAAPFLDAELHDTGAFLLLRGADLILGWPDHPVRHHARIPAEEVARTNAVPLLGSAPAAEFLVLSQSVAARSRVPPSPQAFVASSTAPGSTLNLQPLELGLVPALSLFGPVPRVDPHGAIWLLGYTQDTFEKPLRAIHRCELQRVPARLSCVAESVEAPAGDVNGVVVELSFAPDGEAFALDHRGIVFRRHEPSRSWAAVTASPARTLATRRPIAAPGHLFIPRAGLVLLAASQAEGIALFRWNYTSGPSFSGAPALEEVLAPRIQLDEDEVVRFSRPPPEPGSAAVRVYLGPRAAWDLSGEGEPLRTYVGVGAGGEIEAQAPHPLESITDAGRLRFARSTENALLLEREPGRWAVVYGPRGPARGPLTAWAASPAPNRALVFTADEVLEVAAEPDARNCDQVRTTRLAPAPWVGPSGLSSALIPTGAAPVSREASQYVVVGWTEAPGRAAFVRWVDLAEGRVLDGHELAVSVDPREQPTVVEVASGRFVFTAGETSWSYPLGQAPVRLDGIRVSPARSRQPAALVATGGVGWLASPQGLARLVPRSGEAIAAEEDWTGYLAFERSAINPVSGAPVVPRALRASCPDALTVFAEVQYEDLATPRRGRVNIFELRPRGWEAVGENCHAVSDEGLTVCLLRADVGSPVGFGPGQMWAPPSGVVEEELASPSARAGWARARQLRHFGAFSLLAEDGPRLGAVLWAPR